jgi:hypothetical protein
MRRIAGLAVILGIFLLLVGACRDDVFVEPPPSLTGDYEGIYSYKVGNQTPAEQRITWRFTSNAYLMYFDEVNGTEQIFCNVRGEYQLENGVNLMQIDSNLTGDLCNFGQNPTGFFALEQADTLKMTQFIADEDVLKVIKLVPAN